MNDFVKKMLILTFSSLVIGCGGAKYVTQTTFPDPDEIFITTGDGDIHKPYTPVGELVYYREGYVLKLWFITIISDKVDVDYELKKEIFVRVKEMGGDGLINMRIQWLPPSDGCLGFFETGGSILVMGTVIKR